MEKARLLSALIVALSASQISAARADACTALSGNYCATFNYSAGGTGSLTINFARGAFTINGTSTGTYSCDGKNLMEVDYAFNGFENHVWYGSAKKRNGYGKSTTNGYLYSYSFNRVGECPAAQHGMSRRQDHE